MLLRGRRCDRGLRPSGTARSREPHSERTRRVRPVPTGRATVRSPAGAAGPAADGPSGEMRLCRPRSGGGPRPGTSRWTGGAVVCVVLGARGGARARGLVHRFAGVRGRRGNRAEKTATACGFGIGGFGRDPLDRHPARSSKLPGAISRAHRQFPTPIPVHAARRPAKTTLRGSVCSQRRVATRSGRAIARRRRARAARPTDRARRRLRRRTPRRRRRRSPESSAPIGP
jgi:hypothetical protein